MAEEIRAEMVANVLEVVAIEGNAVSKGDVVQEGDLIAVVE